VQTIPALVRHAAEAFAEREAVADEDTRLSFAALGARIEHAARACVAAGIRPGDRVAIWAPNTVEWIVAALGAVCAGGVLVPINTRFKGREAAYVLARSGARLLFTVNGFLDTDYIGMLRAEGATVPTVVLRGDGADFDAFLARAGSAPLPEVAPDDLSDIIFTSGTTGAPKGVMVSHAQTVRVFDVWSREVGLAEGDRYLIVNPFFHTFGYKAGILACLMRGATIVPHAVFDAASVMARIEAERITVLPGPPTLYQSMLNAPQTADLSSLRLAVTGAAVVPVSLIERMRAELGFETVLTAYGLTESTGTATMCRDGDDIATIANTSGRAIPDTTVRIVNDDGKEVPRGEPGEVMIRGYNVMLGYLDDPAATAEAIEPDGWLHTGDIGVMDDAGNVKITDRKKDMLIVGGFNVYPAEVENELVAHPSIAQAAVVGAPDERMGEVPVAFVVARAGTEVDADAVITWARERIANYKVPRSVIVVDALPVNASGKVLKFELRERL
jgi:HIP---CoA ligase